MNQICVKYVSVIKECVLDGCVVDVCDYFCSITASSLGYFQGYFYQQIMYSPCKLNETNICEIYLCALCLEEERPKSTRMCIGWMCAIIRCSIALGVLHLFK